MFRKKWFWIVVVIVVAGGAALAAFVRRGDNGTLVTPEAYHLTAVSAVEAAERAAQGRVPAGAWTPSKAFGADFITGLPGVEAFQVSARPLSS